MVAVAHIDEGGALRWFGLAELRADLELLRKQCLGSWRALIPVTAKGGKSADGPLGAGQVYITLGDGKKVLRWVPASQVEGIDGGLYIPYWLAREKTKQTTFLGERRLPEALAAALDKLQGDFERHVLMLHAAAEPYQDAERREQPLRAVRAAEDAAQSERQREEYRRLREKQTARLAGLPVHAANVRVEGADWSRRKGQVLRTPWAIDNATVRTSGTRAYIFRAGESRPAFWKPLNCISVTPMPSGVPQENPEA